MSSHMQVIYHIILVTKNLDPVIVPERIGDLNRFIIGVMHENGSAAYNIGGYYEHIHILCDLNPAYSLIDNISWIKALSAEWIIGSNIFPDFQGWQDSHSVLSCSWQKRGPLAWQIENQQKHHLCCTFLEEMEELLTKSGLNYNAKSLI